MTCPTTCPRCGKTMSNTVSGTSPLSQSLQLRCDGCKFCRNKHWSWFDFSTPFKYERTVYWSHTATDPKCYVGDYILPLLPYTITLEQLEKYLVLL